MVATDFLRDQVRSYSDWQAKDRNGCADLSELEQRIAFSLAVLGVISTADTDRSRQLEAQKPVDRAQRAEYLKEMHGLYSQWFKPNVQIIEAIDRAEAQGQHVRDADRFRKEYEYYKLLLRFDPATTAEALNDYDDGKYVPLSEVRDELRRRARGTGETSPSRVAG
jgi:hypothetical protein